MKNFRRITASGSDHPAYAVQRRAHPARRFDQIRLALSLAPLGLGFGNPANAQDLDASPRTSSPAGAEQLPPETYPDEIVVTARYGEALVAPETELDEQRIGNFGAGTIGELLSRISPLLGSAAEQPIILINGERVDSAGGIYGFPPEALERLAILPLEAAGRYGYPGRQRVVNLVLKKHYVSWQTEAGLILPTAGGRHGGRLSGGRFVIDGKARWNAQAQLSRDTALLKSERDAAPDADDLDAYRTLLPSSRAISFNAGVTHPLATFTGTLSLNANRSSNLQLLGLAAVPAEDRDRALRGSQHSSGVGVSAVLSGPLGGWRTNFIVRYSRSWSESMLERVGGGAILADRSRSREQNLAFQLNANRAVMSLPAGQVTTNVSIGVSRNRSFNKRVDGATDEPPGTGAQRNQLDARLSLALPIFSAREGGFAALGDLSLDIAGNAVAASRSPLRSRLDLGANWAPFPALQLRGSMGLAQLIPAFDQLNGPYVEEVRRIYDFTRQEIAEPLWITGGNPALGRGTLRNYSLRASLRPFAAQPLTLTSEYQRQVAKGGVGLLPAPTPVIERTFPERFVRDAAGRLVSVDARPISIARDLSERLDNSVTLSLAPGAGKGEGAAGALAPNPWQFSLSINHGWLLRSELLIRAGLPAIDRLGGDTAQSRHSVGFQLVAARSGLGMTLDGNWQSGFRLRDPDAVGGARDYRHKAVTIMNLRLFAEPGRLLRTAEKPAWLSELNVSIDIQNLFDTYRRVTLGDGRVPAGYERYEVDPLGRTIQLSVRKRF